MCLNCGCGMADTRHKETDITRQDIQRAAEAQGQSFEQAASNITQAFGRMAGSTSGGPQGGVRSTSAAEPTRDR